MEASRREYQQTIEKMQEEKLKNLIKIKKELKTVKDELDHVRAISECGICYKFVSGTGNDYFTAFNPCGHRICKDCHHGIMTVSHVRVQRKCPFCQSNICSSIRLY